jgi:FkbM family methyltransferase
MRHWLDPLLPAGARLSLDALRRLPRGLAQDLVRARSRAVPLDATTLLCRVLGRYKMLVDGRDRGLAPHLLLDGYWEMACTRFVLGQLKPGQAAWDVGANIGYYTVLMADIVGPAGRVVALEPNPRLAELAERSLELNGFAARAVLHRAAASDRAATLRFRGDAADPKNGHVVAPDAPQDPALAEYAVPGLPLDELGERADFLKMDVEGAEEAAWGGMQRLLDRSPGITLLMEFNRLRCADPAALLRDIAARFPLAELRIGGAVAPVEAAALLAREQDTMLVLRRGSITARPR